VSLALSAGNERDMGGKKGREKGKRR